MTTGLADFHDFAVRGFAHAAGSSMMNGIAWGRGTGSDAGSYAINSIHGGA
jgi:hypothetical protein